MPFPVRLISLLLMLLAFPAEAEEFYGPLRIRDMGPVGFAGLQLIPDHAIAPHAGRIGIETNLSMSNTFAMDSGTLEYLESRGTRSELSDAEIAELQAINPDAYIFDASLNVLQLTFHYGLSDHWNIHVAQPVYHFGGGNMDSTIESFHDTFGFDDFGRPYLPRNRFFGLLSFGGETIVLREPPRATGLGDPRIGIRGYWELPEGWAVTVDLVHKFAVQDAGVLLSTGTSDTGIQSSLQWRGTENALYYNLALVRTGDTQPFPEKARNLIPSINFAWEHRLLEDANLVVQVNAQESRFTNGGGSELEKRVFQSSIGLRQRSGHYIWSYALTENLVNFNNTADIGLFVSFTWVP